MRARVFHNACTAAALCATLLAARGAHAFCQATTCDPTKISDMCEFDAQNCLTVGLPLVWQSNCVTVSVQADGAPKQNIDYETALGSVTRAFAAWTGASCDGGPPAMTVQVSGPITCDASEYNPDKGNANIVVFRQDSWPYVGGQDALGLTSVHFEAATGTIWDSDIEVNAVDATLSVGDPVPANAVDLDSLLTHEAGHLLGLAHTTDKSATMFPGYTEGTSTLRHLAQDDIKGICTLYPPGRQASSTSCEPRHGYSDLCGAQQTSTTSDDPQTTPASTPSSKSCSIARVATEREGGAFFSAVLGACLAVTALARRRVRRAKSA